MKKKYVTPHVTVEAFEANEYVAVCWGYDLTGTASSKCDQTAHTEDVTFYQDKNGVIHAKASSNFWAGDKYQYDCVVTYIDTKGTADLSDDVAHWHTTPGWDSTTAVPYTDHFAKLSVKRGVNQS